MCHLAQEFPMSPRLVLLASLLIAGCGSGSIRPSDDTGAIAPAPSPARAAPVVDPDPAPLPSPSPEAPTSDAGPGPAPQVEPGTVLEIRRIGRWVGSGIRGARRLVIRDAATWTQFWSELGAGVRPEVDFSTDLVIAVASGERSSGGHDIEVRQVARTGGQLRIAVVETSPGEGCVITAALTQPVDVVVVPASGVTGWSFIDTRAARPC